MVLAVVGTFACGWGSAADQGEPSGPIIVAGGSGGALGAGGAEASTGGSATSGGSGGDAVGGMLGIGGVMASGGTPSTGGVSASGGSIGSGGVIEPATGGAPPVEPFWSRRVTFSPAPHEVDAYTIGITIEVDDPLTTNCAFTSDAFAKPGEQSWTAPQPQRPASDTLCLVYEPHIGLHRVLSPGPYSAASMGKTPEDEGSKVGSPVGLVVTVEALQLAPLVATVLVEYF